MKTHGNKLKCPWLWYVEHYYTCWAVQLWNIVISIERHINRMQLLALLINVYLCVIHNSKCSAVLVL
jgi:hypothetical protein